jgi:pimeloyl-ACP methyl ester carboxylesterase
MWSATRTATGSATSPARRGSRVPNQTLVVVGGVTLVVKTWSAEEHLHAPVVLLPATAETAEDWDTVASTLAGSRTLHAVNLRGHGPSDWPGTYSIQLLADDVTGLLPQLSDQPVDLVAHSLGGLVACTVASSRPELVGRLVLEDVGLLRPRPPALLARPPGVLRFDWRMVEQVRPEIDNPDPCWAQVVANISSRTLVIAGGPTSTVPQEYVSDLARTLPDGKLITIHAGHLVHATKPGAFTEALQAFLDFEH